MEFYIRASDLVHTFLERPYELSKLQTSLTVQLNFYTLCIALAISASLIWSYVRNKYLRNYSHLPEQSLRTDTVEQLNLFSDDNNGIKQAGLHNYLDEFLSAIKVFGYLERPVFHELTRHMQTRKLLAGDSINLEDEKSFCLVVDGHVQVFFKTERPDHISGDVDDIDKQGYKLLTDVRNGELKYIERAADTKGQFEVTKKADISAPLSSMFSILSLFTEDVKLRHDSVYKTDDADREADLACEESHGSPRLASETEPSSSIDLAEAHTISQANTQRQRPPKVTLQDLPHIPLLDPVAKPRKRFASVHPGIVARATIDTTIAVIPAEVRYPETTNQRHSDD